MAVAAADISRAYLQQLIDRIAMKDSQEVDGAEVIFKEELIYNFRGEVQLYELSSTLPKLDDILTGV
ncbi:hypothetical protein JCGZ_18451 [Jatropha curcas]|uniref:Uncharacterized protein n=1 Tax=Jatropha curcas TaxID=180498 RepID=A0A067K0X6_JATCU|nr:hypothetical protein JCGZ_18451 [Jatropha curcas]